MATQNTCLITLSKGHNAIIDSKDYELVMKASGTYPYKKKVVSKWFAKDDRRGIVYAVCNIRHSKNVFKKVRMHRLILGVTDPKIKVDHRDGNGLNNTRDNLRVSTTQQNLFNSRKYTSSRCTSKYKGVSYRADMPNNPWLGYFNHKGKLHYLGAFKTEIEAASAYNVEASKLRGEFARLNNVS